MSVIRCMAGHIVPRILLLTLFLSCGLGFSSASAEELAVAAASDLKFAIKELIGEYEKQTGHHVKLSLASSGNFYTQLQQGAAFDLYFSADIGYPKKLEEAGLTVPGTLYRYAVGRLVLWVPKSSQLDIEKGLELLRNSGIKKISIANPKHAPYGRAALSAMNYFRVFDMAKDKLVMAENVSQAAKFVESGAADVGIIALSLALSPNMRRTGRYWEVPPEAYPALEQGAVILKQSKNQNLAKQFLQFVQSAEGREIMKRYGFVLPS